MTKQALSVGIGGPVGSGKTALTWRCAGRCGIDFGSPW